MKLNKIFIAALAATTLFASCAKENSTDTNAGTQTILVKLPDNVTVRGVEGQLGTVVPNLNDVTVFMMNGNFVVEVGVIDGADLTAKKKLFNQVPASVNKVLVVANRKGVTISDETNVDAIKRLFTIANQNNLEGVADKTLMGEGIPADGNTLGLDPVDGHPYKEVSITLHALTARMEIGTVKPGSNLDEVELIGVWINNYYTDGSKPVPVRLHGEGDNVWKTNPMVSSALSPTPYANPTMVNPYTDIEYYTPANNDDTNGVTMKLNSKVYAYQVFAGNVPHLILLVKGKYTTPDEDGNQYFIGYVTFNQFRDEFGVITEFEPNKIYKIGVGLGESDPDSGITIDGKDITPLPEKSKFDLGVEVKVTPWTPKTVTPQVN